MTGLELDLTFSAAANGILMLAATAAAIIGYPLTQSPRRSAQVLGVLGFVGAFAFIAPLLYGILTADTSRDRFAAEVQDQIEAHYDVEFTEQIDVSTLRRSGTVDVLVASDSPGPDDARLTYDHDTKRVTLERITPEEWPTGSAAGETPGKPKPGRGATDQGFIVVPDQAATTSPTSGK